MSLKVLLSLALATLATSMPAIDSAHATDLLSSNKAAASTPPVIVSSAKSALATPTTDLSALNAPLETDLPSVDNTNQTVPANSKMDDGLDSETPSSKLDDDTLDSNAETPLPAISESETATNSTPAVDLDTSEPTPEVTPIHDGTKNSTLTTIPTSVHGSAQATPTAHETNATPSDSAGPLNKYVKEDRYVIGRALIAGSISLDWDYGLWMHFGRNKQHKCIKFPYEKAIGGFWDEKFSCQWFR
jgi:hypothetical protein